MNATLVEIENQKLTQHFQRLVSCHQKQKMMNLRFIWVFLHDSIVYKPIIENAGNQYMRFGNTANHVFDAKYPVDISDKDEERFYTTYFIIKRLLKDPRPNLWEMSRKYLGNPNEADIVAFEVFNNLFLEQFIYTFINQANKNFLMLTLLTKYRKRSEWFNNTELLKKITRNTRRGETEVKQDLYKYLFDQGLDIFIEPASPGGEADIIAIERDRFSMSVIEAKVFDSAKNSVSHILRGYTQTLAYLKDHGEKLGYLVIYNTGPELLQITSNQDAILPYVALNGIIIYFVVIDLYTEEEPASRRKARSRVAITTEDFVIK